MLIRITEISQGIDLEGISADSLCLVLQKSKCWKDIGYNPWTILHEGKIRTVMLHRQEFEVVEP